MVSHHPRKESIELLFHSFGRQFNTALAAIGLNVQQAMALAGHKSRSSSNELCLRLVVECFADALQQLFRAKRLFEQHRASRQEPPVAVIGVAAREEDSQARAQRF